MPDGRAGEDAVTAAQARERLLNLFPAQAIRSNWSLGNTTKEKAVEQLVKSASTQEANAFAFENFPLTKQHVHLFLPSATLDPSADQNLMTGETAVARANADDETAYFYLLDVKFEVVFLDTLVREYIDFKWPIVVIVRPKLLQVKFTVLEKDVRSYFESADSGRVVIGRRSADEKAILKIVQDELARLGTKVEPLDINKGVKAMWATDIIDSQDTRFKKSKSVSSEIMDEKFYIKRDAPDVYAVARKSPILKAQFEFMKDQERFVPHFVVEANNGILRFPTYGIRRESTLNVITKILELN
jgi:hypothetical protein